MNETNSASVRSWVDSANRPGNDFPVQNLPFGVFRRTKSDESTRVGIAIGNQILDMKAVALAVPFEGLEGEALQACTTGSLNGLMSLGKDHWSALRKRVFGLLRKDGQEASRHQRTLEKCLVPMSHAELHLPVEVGDYTDFYASVFHATNVGSMLRPDNPLLPNYKFVPIAYHGRASSIVVSGNPIRRPVGQTREDATHLPSFGPCKLMDYELEVGVFIGPGNDLGTPIRMEEAENHIFGLCLLNDWSARDIQKWEYQPLGPFLAKNFATTISPWVVTLEALEPYRVPAFGRDRTDPQPLPYLSSVANTERGGFEISLEVWLGSEAMRHAGVAPVRLSRGSFRDMYWTVAQMLTHHTSNGCNLRSGDLLGSGTVSGSAKETRGCLLELTWRGSEPIELPTGELRRFLQDGDEVILRGYGEREGSARIGFGECRGIVLPAGM